MTRKPRIAVSMGDPNGIGPEILLGCLDDRGFEPVLVGHPLVFERYAGEDRTWTGFDLEVIELPEGFGVRPGKLDAQAGAAAIYAVERAVDLCLEGRVDAMVTCPISKEAVRLAGHDVPGHTEFIAARCGVSRVTMMLVSDALRVGLATTHLPLRDVPDAVTREAVLGHLRVMDSTLRRDYAVAHPRIAVFGLNPHAGEGGQLGSEEMDCIVPALEKARAEGLNVSGPFPADGFFGSGAWKQTDAILAMYHDQGLGPFKALTFGSGVNHTAGLPIVRTSPDHGTAFDIAGKGEARTDSLRAALKQAGRIVRNRNTARSTT